MSNLNKRNPRSILFLHLPKTAGTTLNNIIARQYQPEEIHYLGALTQKAIVQFKAMDAAERAKFRLLTGHMGYGLHDQMAPPTAYFTILREPIERIISFYYFVQRNGAHYLHDFVLKDDVGLDDFVKSRISIMTDNFQVRLISGVWDQRPYGECSREALEQAKQNLLTDFAVVGLTEEFDKTLILLKRAFNWRHVYYLRQNATQNRPQTDSFSQQTLDTVRAYNQLDLELYAFAQNLFVQQMKQQGVSFSIEAWLFPRINRLVQIILNNRNRFRR
ncbi:MAG: sulfotransferase family 2 domain-containing protein [Chloroflexi bacterium]|nr:sulfotransferase family 2 domain-containing protein [Chloroflexota bacterium]